MVARQSTLRYFRAKAESTTTAGTTNPTGLPQTRLRSGSGREQERSRGPGVTAEAVHAGDWARQCGDGESFNRVQSQQRECDAGKGEDQLRTPVVPRLLLGSLLFVMIRRLQQLAVADPIFAFACVVWERAASLRWMRALFRFGKSLKDPVTPKRHFAARPSRRAQTSTNRRHLRQRKGRKHFRVNGITRLNGLARSVHS
jgi:hypothetical protein